MCEHMKGVLQVFKICYIWTLVERLSCAQQVFCYICLVKRGNNLIKDRKDRGQECLNSDILNNLFIQRILKISFKQLISFYTTKGTFILASVCIGRRRRTKVGIASTRATMSADVGLCPTTLVWTHLYAICYTILIYATKYYTAFSVCINLFSSSHFEQCNNKYRYYHVMAIQ